MCEQRRSGKVWVWRYQQEHSAGEGLSEWPVLMTPRLAGHQDRRASTCCFTRHPDLETKWLVLMTARSGMGRRYCQFQKDTGRYANPVHGHQPRRHEEVLIAGIPCSPWQSQQILDLLPGHNLHVAWNLGGWLERADLVPGGCTCECETVNVAEWNLFCFFFILN